MSQIQKKIYITDDPTRKLIDCYYSDKAEVNNTSQSYEMQKALLEGLTLNDSDKQYWIDIIYSRPETGLIDALHEIMLTLKLASITELKSNKELLKYLVHQLGISIKNIKEVDEYFINRFKTSYEELENHMIGILPATGIDNYDFFISEIKNVGKHHEYSVDVNDICYFFKILEKFWDNIYLVPLLYSYLTEVTYIIDIINNANNRLNIIKCLKELKWK